jgi:hypothetical protein
MPRPIDPFFSHSTLIQVSAAVESVPEHRGFFEGNAGLWAALSAAAAFLSLVVGAVGLYFIWRQLKASRAALETSS